MRRNFGLVMPIVVLLVSTMGVRQGSPQPPSDTPLSSERTRDDARLSVVAQVNGARIRLSECHRYLNRLPFISDENRDQHTPWALQSLIDRQIVLDYLRTRAELLRPGEVEAALEGRRQALARRGQLLQTALADAGIDEEVLARGITWNLVWSRYLAKTLTPERLRKYFEKHAAHFDGRQLNVSHILWPLAAEADPGELAAKLQEARDVLAEIRAGSMTFAEAARRYSQGPSAAQDGELGWIDREGPMTERFSRAAFELQAGGVSQPVTDQFGVHLICCQDIRPGRTTLREVRFEVERAARQDLFESLVKRGRRRAEIEYTGVIAPYTGHEATTPAAFLEE